MLHSISVDRKNPHYLKNVVLAAGIKTSVSLEDSLSGAECVVFSVPSQATRSVAKQAASLVAATCAVVSTAKGLEESTHKRMTQVLSAELGGLDRIAVLSGPSFALEVASGLPTAVTIASHSQTTSEKVAAIFHFDNLRIYRSLDVAGVELGGTVKNVIALAAGIVDGMNLGLNARAALITRGLAEMKRLIEKVGGSPNTVMGLSGLGDLLLTATGELSRNRTVGVALGKGRSLEETVQGLGQVAEGVKAAKQVIGLAMPLGVEMPIVSEVARIIDGDVTPQGAMKSLLTRALKDE